MLGRLGDDAPLVVEPLPAGPPADLLEVADGEDPHLRAVELRQLREEDGPDRDVHPDAERVGPADDVEEPLLGELLDQQAVARQEPRVVDTDAEREEPAELLAVRRDEAPPRHDLPDLLPLLLAPDLDAGERLRQLGALALREVDDVDRALLLVEEVLDRLVERHLAVLVVERHRPLVRRHEGHLPPRVALQPLGDGARVAERRRHQEELGPREDEERHLPRHAALLVGVVVELVHHDVGGVERLPQPERHVREDLGRAAEDEGLGVDRGVAGPHSDVLGPQLLAEGEELLAGERLDRAGVDRDPPLAERLEVHAEGDERLPRPGRRPEDHVLARHDLEERLLLRRVERQPRVAHPVEEEPQDLVAVARPRGGNAVGEGCDRAGLAQSHPAFRKRQ